MKKPLERFNKPSSIEDVMDCEVVLNVSESYGVTIQIEPLSGAAPNDIFWKNICSEDDLRSRIFETFLACLPLLGFSNI